jgi:hypothetical protein
LDLLVVVPLLEYSSRCQEYSPTFDERGVPESDPQRKCPLHCPNELLEQVAVGYESVGRVEEYSSSETVVVAIAAETRDLRRRITKRTAEKEATVEPQVWAADCHRNLRKHFHQPKRKTENGVAVMILQEWSEKEDAVDSVEKVGLPWPRARETVLYYLDFVRPLYNRSMHASYVTVVCSLIMEMLRNVLYHCHNGPWTVSSFEVLGAPSFLVMMILGILTY